MATKAPPTQPSRPKPVADVDDPLEPFGYDVLTRKLRCSQSLAERLVALGPSKGGIGSITIGMPGSKRKRRMFTDEHVREYLERNDNLRQRPARRAS